MIRSTIFMQHRMGWLVLFFIMVLIVSTGVRADFVTTPVWQVTSGLDHPESVVYDTIRDRLYVSNVGTAGAGGYISIVSSVDGQMIDERWVEGLIEPKGLALSLASDKLYVADGDALVEIAIDAFGGGRISQEYPVEAGLYDVAMNTGSGNVYVSEDGGQIIYRLMNGQLETWVDGLDAALPLLAEEHRLVVANILSAEFQAIDYEDKTVTTIDMVANGVVQERLFNEWLCLTGDGADGYYIATDSGDLFHVMSDGTATEMLAGILTKGIGDLIYIPTRKLLIIPTNGIEGTLTAFKEETFKLTVVLNDTTATPELAGRVVSDPAGIDCGEDCEEEFVKNHEVILTATPDSTSAVFASWTGDCIGTDNPVTVTMDADKTCTPVFEEAPPDANVFTLTITAPTNGKITTQDSSIDCGGICTKDYAEGTEVSLNATADAGFSFAGWTSDCVGTETTLILPMDANKNCSGTFQAIDTPPSTASLTVQKQGTGSGIVTSNVGDIHCGDTCQANYDLNTAISLIATPDAGSTLLSWGENCPNGQITMSADQTCIVTFEVPVTPIPSVTQMTVTVEGGGTVSADKGTIQNCGAPGGVCIGDYTLGDMVTFTATATTGSSFDSWSASCVSVNATASVTMTGNSMTCGAKFLSPVTPSVPSLPLEPSLLPTSELCLIENIVKGTCNAQGLAVTGVSVTQYGNVSNLLISGNTDNLGWISNSTIQKDAVVTGGVLTGFIINKGTLANIEFRGASIKGGVLSGTIMNIRNGLIEDVTLTAGTHLQGGKIKGRIIGDLENPAVLENVTIDASSHLSGVILGENVVVMEGAVIDPIEGGTQPGVIWPELPSLGIGLAVDKKGRTLANIQADFAGGVSLDEGKTFMQQVIIKPLTDSVDMRGIIKADATHVGKRADTFVFILYKTSSESQPVHLMVDKDHNILPWDENMASLVAFQEDVELTTEQRSEIYQGILLYDGIVEISYGYRLNDGTVVYSAENINMTITKESEGVDDEKEPSALKIGLLLPKTGSLEAFGSPTRNGAALAIEHLTAAGYEVETVDVDSQSDATAGVEAAQQLVDKDEVTVIVGAVSSAVTLAVAEQVTIPNGILHISPGSSASNITNLEADNGKDLLFRTNISDALQGIQLATLVKEKGYSKVSSLYVDNAYGQNLNAIFTKSFEELGGSVVGAVAHPNETVDSFMSELEQLTVEDSELLVALSYPQHIDVYVKEAIDNDLFKDFAFASGSKSENLVDVVGAEALEGLCGTQPSLAESDSLEQFTVDYQTKFGEIPTLFPYAAATYDAIVSATLAAYVAESKGKDQTGLNIRDQLREVAGPAGERVTAGSNSLKEAKVLLDQGKDINYLGASGEVDYDEAGDVVRPMEVWCYQNGEMVVQP